MPGKQRQPPPSQEYGRADQLSRQGKWETDYDGEELSAAVVMGRD